METDTPTRRHVLDPGTPPIQCADCGRRIDAVDKLPSQNGLDLGTVHTSDRVYRPQGFRVWPCGHFTEHLDLPPQPQTRWPGRPIDRLDEIIDPMADAARVLCTAAATAQDPRDIGAVRLNARALYRAAVKLHHPDRGGDPAKLVAATTAFETLTE